MKSQKLINHFKKQPFERQLHFVCSPDLSLATSLHGAAERSRV